MPDFERFTRELEIKMETTEEGKEALRRHFKRVDKSRWDFVKVFSFFVFIAIIVSIFI